MHTLVSWLPFGSLRHCGSWCHGHREQWYLCLSSSFCRLAHGTHVSAKRHDPHALSLVCHGCDFPSRGLLFHCLAAVLLGTDPSHLDWCHIRHGWCHVSDCHPLGDLLSRQHGQWSNSHATCTAAFQPKTVNEFFNTHLTEKVLFLYDVALTHNLQHETITTRIHV